MEWIKRYGGWAVAVLAILYATNAPSEGDRSYYPPVIETAAISESDPYAAYAEPTVDVAPTPIPPAAPAKGWYDPRYVSCVANCENVEPRIPSEEESSSAPRLIYRHTASDASAPPTETYSLPATQPEQATSVSAPLYNASTPAPANPPAYYAASPQPSTPAPSVGGCAENGSCYGDISPATGAPKTVAVQGYYRSDGTYVRGHYRSRPRN